MSNGDSLFCYVAGILAWDKEALQNSFSKNKRSFPQGFLLSKETSIFLGEKIKEGGNGF